MCDHATHLLEHYFERHINKRAALETCDQRNKPPSQTCEQKLFLCKKNLFFCANVAVMVIISFCYFHEIFMRFLKYFYDMVKIEEELRPNDVHVTI